MEVQIYLILAVAMFVSGLYVLLSKRNALMTLVGVELMLNAANLNFLAFSQYHQNLEGQVFTLFVMVVAAAEVALALAIILKLYQYFKESDLDIFQSLHS
ncbi:MAG: NADH-quinone oxidoreductase subunit NuoK [Raineya sp.]